MTNIAPADDAPPGPPAILNCATQKISIIVNEWNLFWTMLNPASNNERRNLIITIIVIFKIAYHSTLKP